MQLQHRLGEPLDVIQLHERTRGGRREEIHLAAAVIAHDRQAVRHRFEEHEPEALVLARRNENVAHAERRVLLLLGHVTEHLHAVRHARFARRAHHRFALRPVADNREVNVLTRRGGEDLYQLGGCLSRHHAAHSGHYEGIFGDAVGRATPANARGRPRDAERHQFYLAIRPVDARDVGAGVARLCDDRIRALQHLPDGRTQEPVTVRRRWFRRIVEVTPVHREHVGICSLRESQSPSGPVGTTKWVLMMSKARLRPSLSPRRNPMGR